MLFKGDRAESSTSISGLEWKKPPRSGLSRYGRGKIGALDLPVQWAPPSSRQIVYRYLHGGILQVEHQLGGMRYRADPAEPQRRPAGGERRLLLLARQLDEVLPAR